MPPRHTRNTLFAIALLCLAPLLAPASRSAGVAPADFREIVNNARRTAFPSVVYLHCIIENFERGERLCVSASGSGVIISADGEVVTNWHVVNKAVEVRALLNDGRAFPVEIIGADKDSDLALVRLKLPPGETVSVLEIATDDTLQEGDFVMALGAPWGLNRTVTFGIISCARRYLPSNSEYSTWIQTDTSISPGNSGGPLVDLSGKIVGINARGMLFGGDTGFAVPASMVRLLVSRLRVGGTNGANWTWTGLQLQPLRDFQRNIYFEGDRGAIVTGTDENSPAREAGIRSQDRLIRINGADITARMEEDLPQIRRMLATLPTDKPAQLTVLRDGNEVELSIHPRAKGSVQGEELTCPRWDFTVKEINKFEVPDLSYQRASGVYISGIRHPGNAAASGLAVRDIVVSINGIEVRGIDEIRAIHEKSVAALKAGTGARRIVIMVMRGGQLLQVVIDISKDYAVK